jgi:hypothetical protein
MKYVSTRVIAIILIAVAFGTAAAVLKGGDAGVRDAIGNISAPWLLLPYFAGTLTRGRVRGAVMGAMACLAALLAFYVTEAFVLELGGHPVLTNLALTIGAGRMYFAAGAVCGPLFGAIGGLHTRFRLVVTAAVVGLALVGEPLAVFVWLAHMGMSPSDTGLVVQYPALWIGEVCLGLVLGLRLLTGGIQGTAQRQTSERTE